MQLLNIHIVKINYITDPHLNFEVQLTIQSVACYLSENLLWKQNKHYSNDQVYDGLTRDTTH